MLKSLKLETTTNSLIDPRIGFLGAAKNARTYENPRKFLRIAPFSPIKQQKKTPFAGKDLAKVVG